jgi:carboxymethylenebutenolidase
VKTVVARAVDYPCSDGYSMPAYLTMPDNCGPFAGLVFIVEATGLHKKAKQLADDMAAEGYAVIAPDMFSRASHFACLVQLFKDMQAGKGQGVDDLIAARNWLAEQPFIEKDKIAVVGFCLGGAFALILSKTGLFKVAADFYGQIPDSLENACSIFGAFGERDLIVNGRIPHLKSQLAKHDIPNEIYVYPGAGHGFMHEQVRGVASVFLKYGPGRGGYNREVANDAKVKLFAFLKEQLPSTNRAITSSPKI